MLGRGALTIPFNEGGFTQRDLAGWPAVYVLKFSEGNVLECLL